MEGTIGSLFQKVIEHLPEGFLAYSPEFKIIAMNPAAERILGVPAAEVLGKTFSLDVDLGPKMAIFRQALFPSLAPKINHLSSPGDYPQVVDIIFPDPRREFRTTTIQIADVNGRLSGFVKIIEDRTREAMILQSKSEFVSLVSHQLRTPLTAINWTFQILMKEAMPDTQRELVKTGALATAELVSRIDDAIEVTKIEDGRFDYKFSEFDLGGLIADLIEKQKLVGSQYEVGIDFKKPEGAVKLMADEHKLGVAIANIVNNAVRYSKPGTAVIVTIAPGVNKTVVVSIGDKGIGISDSDKGKIFTKFFRAENARKVQPDGNGLGLFIAKNVIETHGGSVAVASTLGEGSTFTLTLPTDPSLIPLYVRQKGNH